ASTHKPRVVQMNVIHALLNSPPWTTLDSTTAAEDPALKKYFVSRQDHFKLA
ncbi:hypothetical protein J6590_013406, partial [Homalodisca vitripennis]